MKWEIFLVPVGSVPAEALRWLSGELPSAFECTCKVGPISSLPRFAWDARRQQYDAERILAKVGGSEAGVILAVADVDLFVSGLNFVFGLAQPRTRKAIISLSRLRQSFYGARDDDELFRSRILKEAVHELGHVFGLNHCHDRDCVMAFSNRLADTDYKSEGFCKECEAELRSKLSTQ